MAFFSSDSQRPPLRHRDLDALSDRELEALLFDGVPPKKRRSWLPGSATGWAGLGAGALLVLALTAATEGVILVPLFVAAVVFGVAKKAFSCTRPARPKRTDGRQLTRSATDRKMMGVCGGLAEYFDVDSTPVRLGFLLGLVVTGGPPMVLAYLVLAYVLPSAPAVTAKERLRIIRES